MQLDPREFIFKPFYFINYRFFLLSFVNMPAHSFLLASRLNFRLPRHKNNNLYIIVSSVFWRTWHEAMSLHLQILLWTKENGVPTYGRHYRLHCWLCYLIFFCSIVEIAQMRQIVSVLRYFMVVEYGILLSIFIRA